MQADDKLSHQERCDAGSALNWVGDPRFNPQNRFLPNDENFGFIEIPAGPFLMGSDKNKDYDADEAEFPQHTVELAAYEIARYPVTTAQFRAFAEDRGYGANEKWKRGDDNHPVVNISWHDAMAYCEWLTEKLNNGKIITLPTEAQWEKAARGKGGRIYPWGEQPDTNRANYHNTGIGAASPVGCFPSGKSEYGITDMCGNGREWTHSLWGKKFLEPDFVYPYNPADGRENIKSDAYRVIRGGSWHGVAGECRSADRYGDFPDARDGGYGFRLVLLPGQK